MQGTAEAQRRKEGAKNYVMRGGKRRLCVSLVHRQARVQREPPFVAKQA
jgi:hypothetical protein